MSEVATNQPPTVWTEQHDALVERAVQLTITKLGLARPPQEFISSKDCARLLGVTAVHLAAMRARDEGPPWSGQKRWIRYERSIVLAWIANQPRKWDASPRGEQESTSNGPLKDNRSQVLKPATAPSEC